PCHLGFANKQELWRFQISQYIPRIKSSVSRANNMQLSRARAQAIHEVGKDACLAVFEAWCDLRHTNIAFGKMRETLFHLTPETRFLPMLIIEACANKSHRHKRDFK